MQPWTSIRNSSRTNETESETGICASLKFKFILVQREINSSFREVQNVVLKKLIKGHDSKKATREILWYRVKSYMRNCLGTNETEIEICTSLKS